MRARLPVPPGRALTLMVLCRVRGAVRRPQLRADLRQALNILAERLKVRTEKHETPLWIET